MPEIPDDADPVQRLLTLGEVTDFGPETWPDYPAQFGFGPAHIPALIGLACDLELNELSFDEPRAWAPMHAWRALAQLRAESAVEPLLNLRRALGDHEAVLEDIPRVIGMIGPAAIPAVTAFIEAEIAHEGGTASTGTEALREIGSRHPETRATCVQILTDTLGRHAEAMPTVNGLTISALLDLKGVEAIETIRAAFAAESVNLSIAGDLEDVEIDFGLRAERTTPRPHYGLLPFAAMQELQSLFEDAADTHADESEAQFVPVRTGPKIGRNEPCPCGSGKKYKKCCLAA